MAENSSSEQPPRSGKPSNPPKTMSRRDRERLNSFNKDKVEERRAKGLPSWSNKTEVEMRYTQAKDWKTKNPANKQTQRFKPSTTQTPPKNEDPYDGDSVGSKPVKKTICHNLDFAGFGILIEQVYQQALRTESRLTRMLPFPVYQHAMVEFLNAYILHQQKFGTAHPDLQNLMDPLEVIRAKDFKIPKPIYDYIVSIGPALTPAADKIVVNYPRAAVPQGVTIGIDAAPPLCAVDECDSGSFGIPAANNHNLYECYWSPLVTSKYITHSLSENKRRGGIRPQWSPFPEGWIQGEINENLLGWHPIIKYHSDALAKLEMCEFINDDTIGGRLAHCPYALNVTCSTLADLKINCVPADFTPKFGIIIRKTPINSGPGKEKTYLEVGTLVQVKPPQSDSDRNIRFSIKEYDDTTQNPLFSQEYECPSHFIMKVLQDVWPYVISIPVSERASFLGNKDKINFTLNLKEGDRVSVDGTFFDHQVNYECIVKYCGMVPEIGKGLFFGLEILNSEFYDYSPQTPDIPFAKKYCYADAENCLFVPANFLLKPDDGLIKTSNNDGFTKVTNKKNSSSKKFLDKIKTNNKVESVSSKYQTQPQIFSDEYSEGVLNYENKLEERQSETSRTMQKNKKSKPFVMNYDNERDIVVIEEDEIQKPGKVVVVKKKEDVDLADLLGQNWPTNGGEPCEILNSEPSKSNLASSMKSTNTKVERNKSPNVLSHISGKYKTNNLNRNGDFPGYTESELTKLDTATGGARIKDKEKMKNINFSNNYTNGSFSNNKFEILDPEPEPVKYFRIQEIPGTNLEVESMVKIIPEKLFGVIKWIGKDLSHNILVGVELLEENLDVNNLILTDGTHNGNRYFSTHDKRAIFVEADRCLPDDRFNEVVRPSKKNNDRNFEKEVDPSKMFGNVECPIIKGSVAPLKYFNCEDLETICGEFKGIQGHHNSCYLDATLFAMFTFTSVFDSLLFRPAESTDIDKYEEVQTVLREEIVNPLRDNIFVRADRVLKLRQLLEKLSSITGLTSEEKDPEEFLNSLLAQIMKAEPFLKLNSGQDAYFYQLFVEKDERIKFPTVQELFEQSFLSSDIKLKQVPSCLIIQMPRFGKNYKMYPRILPSQVLDVTDIIEDSPRQCSVCGKLAHYECRDCFKSLHNGSGLENTSFCKHCLVISHNHIKRQNHTHKELSTPEEFKQQGDTAVPPRIFMELFAVVCIETSHYVSFVKAGPGADAPWCFFDSMADRKGEQNGYNIPRLMSVPDLPNWISDEGAKLLNEGASTDKQLPEHAKRLFCDAYMCMYQSTDVMMYQ